MNNKFFLIIVLVAFASCTNKPIEIGTVDAYVPIYESAAAIKTITQTSAQPIINGGKIATKGNLIFQVETGRGLHIIDYSNPAAPVKKSFIRNLTCQELTIKGNYLYTNNGNDLVVLDITDINNVKLGTRLADAFPNLIVDVPPARNVYFVCPDDKKGMVTGWELKKVDNPKCRN